MKKIIKFIIIVLSLVLTVFIVLGRGFGDRERISLNNGKPIVFAHRGVIDLCVENSKTAFSQAKLLGFKAIETDIRRTIDGRLILFHDATGERLLNNKKEINEIRWEELENTVLQFDGVQTNDKVLLLDDFLSEISPSTILYLDVKEASWEVADSLIFLINKYDKFENVIVANADFLFLSYIKYRNSSVLTALEGFNKGKEWLYHIIPKDFKPDYLASFYSQINKNHISFLKENNLMNQRIVYGVNSKNLSKVSQMGIPHIIYDYDVSSDNLETIKQLLYNDN